MSKFGDVDVCMGIHGAGLANCVFGPPGVTIFEMQTRFHNFGFDSFMKVAHMASGTHVMMDTEGMYNKKTGVVLQNSTLTDIVGLLEVYSNEDQALLLKRCTSPVVPEVELGGVMGDLAGCRASSAMLSPLNCQLLMMRGDLR